MNEATPRISAAYLETFQGQTVRVLGKVTQLRGDHATVDAGGEVGVVLNRVSLFSSHSILLMNPEYLLLCWGCVG